MQLPQSALEATNWTAVTPTMYPGETGEAIWRTVEMGDVRIRLVEYSPGYVADHWCDKGHIGFVIEGELLMELQDGRSLRLSPGMSFHVSDFGDAAHRVRAGAWTKLFIID